MLGVLFDVSGSMKETFAVYYDRYDRDHDVKKSHAIVTTLNSIVNQEIMTYQRNESLFACSFGLNKSKCGGSDTCDLIALLEDRLAFKEVKQKLSELLSEKKRIVEQEKQQMLQIEEQQKELRQEQNKCEGSLQRIEQHLLQKQQKRRIDGYTSLIQLAYDKGASHAADWIKTCLSEEEAGILYDVLYNDSQLTRELIKLIPSRQVYYAAKTVAGMQAKGNAVRGARFFLMIAVMHVQIPLL